MRIALLFTLAVIYNTITAQTLFPGDPAPALTVGKWVKGTAVNEFKENNIYVVEFWATWCGPCKISIPHLTELAHKYKNKVSVTGVSIAETNTANVAPFVEKMGDKMDYNVAIDQQSSETARSGFMSKNWLEAAGLNGIPAAFVIGKKGNIEFIGSPEELDSVLALVTTDKWDSKTFANKWKSDKDAEAKIKAVYNDYQVKLDKAVKEKDSATFYKTFDQYIQHHVNDPSRGWGSVNEIVWAWLADPESKLIPAGMKNYTFGIPWMEKLNAKADFKNPAFIDTLAWLYYASGNKSKAVENEEMALKLIPVSDPSRGEYEKALSVFSK